MKTTHASGWIYLGLLALTLLAPSGASAQLNFDRLVVFGTSLSDPGNAFALTQQNSAPPYANLNAFLIPDAAYAKGGHHFSNGATWIEQFARPLDLADDVRPAFQDSEPAATNYAVGGARARDAGDGINLSTQVAAFLADFAGQAPAGALYVLEIGGNDVRDAIAAGLSGLPVIFDALEAVDANLEALYTAGARQFLVGNSPNLALTPAIRKLDLLNPGAADLALFYSQAYNLGLEALLDQWANAPGIEIVRLDLFAAVNGLAADPQAFGLSETEAACVSPGVPPYSCKAPAQFLFWDGIHPTRAVHGIVAQLAAAALAE